MPTYHEFTKEEKRAFAIEQHNSAKPKALQRDPIVDYTQGYFFVTLTVHDRLPILGSIPNSHECRLTALGEKVLSYWNAIPSHYPNAQLLEAQVMPNHFHGLLHLDVSYPGVDLGKVIKGFKVGCTHAYWDILGIPWRTMMGRTDGKTDDDWVDDIHTESKRGPALFSAGFNETEPLTEEQIDAKINYIRTNPERSYIKRQNKDCFTIYRNQTSKNWTEQRVLSALQADAYLGKHPEAVLEAMERLRERLSFFDISKTKLGLAYVGKRDLLLAERKLPLVCHRADAERIEEQTRAMMNAAQQGAVIVSAFISAHEREIRKQLLVEGYPIIEIVDNGFSDHYKPLGRSFYACAEGQLLQISCWNYLYQKEAQVSREMCLVMNELSRLIADSPDDWWK